MWLLNFAGWSLNPTVFLGAQLSLQPAWSTSAAHPVLLRWCENPCSYLDVKPHLSLVDARASVSAANLLCELAAIGCRLCTSLTPQNTLHSGSFFISSQVPSSWGTSAMSVPSCRHLWLSLEHGWLQVIPSNKQLSFALGRLAEGLSVIAGCIRGGEGGVQNDPAGNLASNAISGSSWERLRKFWFSEVNFTHLCTLCGA